MFTRSLVAVSTRNSNHFLPSKSSTTRSLSSSSSSNTNNWWSSSKNDNPVNVVQGPNLLTTSTPRPSPTLMMLPGLRSLPFWTRNSPGEDTRVAFSDPTLTALVAYLEGHASMIREEYVAKADSVDQDYQDAGHDHSKLHKGSWKWHTYMNKGTVANNFSSFATNFPQTHKILDNLRQQQPDLFFEDMPFGFCFLSTLGSHSKIEPHSSPMNLRLRIHLPLLVPSDKPQECGIQVGSQIQPWIPDKCMILDDSYPHQVWNDTDDQRVLLLLDVWHPDVSPTERTEIVGLFQQAKEQGLWKE